MGSIDREYADLRRLAEQAGWRIAQTRKGERWMSPDRQHAIQVHRTDSDWRGIRNTRSRLRRAGLQVA